MLNCKWPRPKRMNVLFENLSTMVRKPNAFTLSPFLKCLKSFNFIIACYFAEKNNACRHLGKNPISPTRTKDHVPEPQVVSAELIKRNNYVGISIRSIFLHLHPFCIVPRLADKANPIVIFSLLVFAVCSLFQTEIHWKTKERKKQLQTRCQTDFIFVDPVNYVCRKFC